MRRLALAAAALLLSAPCLAGTDQAALDQSLRQAARDGIIPRIRELVRGGARVNAKALHGESALEYAIRFGRYGAAFALIRLGADPNSEDDSGLSPLLRAAGECNASRVVEALLKAGARVNHHDYYGRTALINAAHADCPRTVAVLLLRAKDDIELDARDDASQSAYDVARDGLVPELLDLAHRYRQDGGEKWLELANQVRR